MNEGRGSWLAGYRGKDSMRDKAHKLLGIEQKGARYAIPESMSSPGHSKMRLFAEGGHATGGEADGAGRDYKPGTHPGVPSAGKLKRGGHTPHRAEGGRFAKGGHAKHHKLSDEQSNMHLPCRGKTAPIRKVSKEHAENLRHGGTPKLNVESVKEFENMKRGGKTKHHFAAGGHAKKKFDMGGPVQTRFGSAPGAQPMPPMVSPGATTPQPAFKKGGHMKHKAKGGSIYEKQMVGERPSHKAPHINYESEMRGEHPTRKPSAKHESKKGLEDKNHGQLFAAGGKAAGGVTKMAAGGVGKIRHNAASASGKPKGAGKVIRNNLF